MSKRTLVKGGTLIVPREESRPGDVLIEDDRILSIGTNLGNSDDVIDASGMYVAPGFVDLHIQGTLGRDVWERDTDGIAGLAESLPKFGCTSFLATTHYDENHAPALAERIAASPAGAKVLGLHLEGPFVHPKRSGALSEQTSLPVSVESTERILEKCAGHLRMMTLDPSLPNGLDVVSHLHENDVIPSLGHTDSDYETVVQAVERGLCHATHCFNAMRPLSHREPGALGGALLCDEISIQIVADNHHLHAAMYELVSRVKPWEKIVLITDAVRAAGMPPGRYESEGHGKIIFLKNGAVTLEDGTIAGSALTMDAAVRNFKEAVGCSLTKAIELVTLNPAEVLGLENDLGSLATGKMADIVLLDNSLNVKKTLVDGRTVYQRD